MAGGLLSCDTAPGTSLLLVIQVLKWVLDRTKEIQHCIGLSCDIVIDQFMALFAAVEAG